MQYFPIFVDLVNKPVLVIGGGEVASRKVAMLCEAQADVLVVSPTLSDELAVKLASGEIRYQQAEYQASDILGMWQVWATTNNSELNQRIHQDATAANVLCNVVDSLSIAISLRPLLSTVACYKSLFRVEEQHLFWYVFYVNYWKLNLLPIFRSLLNFLSNLDRI